MRILAIVYCFPPLLVPAAIRCLKIVLGLRAHGAEVEVLAIHPRSFLAPGPGLLDPYIGRVVPADLIQHTVWSPEGNGAVRLLKRLMGTTPLGMRFFEPRKREWTYPALRYLKRLDLGRYDIILTSSQPHANHLIGLDIKKHTGLPWVAYFGDPWSRNPYARIGSRRIVDYHRALEREVLTTADRVLFTSEEMLRLAEEDHAAVLQGKAGVLPHAFVPEWFGSPQTPMRGAGPIRVLHTGHFYGPRSPAPFVRALGRLHRRRNLVGDLQIDSYGTFPTTDRESLAREGLDQVLLVHPVIPYLDSLELMRRHDALLLIDAKLSQTAESVFLPSKLVDYLGSGTPIMAVTPVPGATARTLSETGGLVCDIENEGAIENALVRLLEIGDLPRPEPAAVQPYNFMRVAGRLLSIMTEIAGK